MSAIELCWPKFFFPHLLSWFRNKRHILYPNYTLSFNKLSCECAIVVLIPKIHFSSFNFLPIRKVTIGIQVFSSFLFSFRLKRKTLPFSFRNGRHILFYSKTKEISYTPTIPFLTFKIFHFEAYKYLFHNLSHLFVYFIDFRMCVVNPNYTLPIPCFSLWSERHVVSHGITSFSIVFYLFCVFFLVLSSHSCRIEGAGLVDYGNRC